MTIDFEGIKNNRYYSYPNHTVNINGRYYIIQCPEEINSDTTFYIAGKGAGGVGDTRSIFAAAKGKNVIMIAPVNADDKDFSTALDVIDALSGYFNIGSTQTTISGFSMTGPSAIRAAVE